jgi:DNA recombination protein RmuC
VTAIQASPELLQEAWEKNVLLVGPSTLLFVLRTVAHLWRQEARNRNAQEIARLGGELYDKLHSFMADLEKVGQRLQQAKESYDDAHSRLGTGKNNAMRLAGRLCELGVKPKKLLAPEDLERANDSHDAALLRENN